MVSDTADDPSHGGNDLESVGSTIVYVITVGALVLVGFFIGLTLLRTFVKPADLGLARLLAAVWLMVWTACSIFGTKYIFRDVLGGGWR